MLMFNAMQTALPAMVFGTFALTVVSGLIQWDRGVNSPVSAVPAVVADKRREDRHHHHTDASTGVISVRCETSYYLIFQMDSGEQMEFQVLRRQYQTVCQGDRGMLRFQGTQYLNFSR